MSKEIKKLYEENNTLLAEIVKNLLEANTENSSKIEYLELFENNEKNIKEKFGIKHFAEKTSEHYKANSKYFIEFYKKIHSLSSIEDYYDVIYMNEDKIIYVLERDIIEDKELNKKNWERNKGLYEKLCSLEKQYKKNKKEIKELQELESEYEKEYIKC